MLIFGLSLSFYCLYGFRLKVFRCFQFWINTLLAFFICFLMLFETLLYSPHDIFFRLDEKWFFDEALKGFGQIFEAHSRYLGFVFINKIGYLTSFNMVIGLKFYLLPFALITSLILYDGVRHKNVLLFFPFVFPFFYALGSLNMRDVIIYLLSMLLLVNLARGNLLRGIVFFMCCVSLLVVFRLEQAMILSLVVFWFALYKVNKSAVVSVFLPIILVFFIFVTPLSWVLYEIAGVAFGTDRIELYLLSRSEEVPTFLFFNENFLALIRQLVTPFPISKLASLFDGPPSNLYFYELFRIQMMLAVYAMTGCLIFNARKVIRLLVRNDFLILLLMVSFLNSIAYGVFADGGGDSRNKLFPYFLIFLLFMSLRSLKYEGFSRSTILKPKF